MINAMKVFKTSRDLGCVKPFLECKELVTQYNQQLEALILEGSPYSVELWDKQTPINGVPAEAFLSGYRYPVDAIYILKKNGAILFVQPYSPKDSGFVPMTPEEALRIASEQAIEAYRNDAQGLFEEAIVEALII